IRNKMDLSGSFIDLLKLVKENSLKAYENQSLQFEELVSMLEIKRNKSRSPLFDVIFDMTDINILSDVKLGEMNLEVCLLENKVSKFDLSLVVVERENDLKVTFEYSVNLFKKEKIQQMVRDFELIISETINCISAYDEVSIDCIIMEDYEDDILEGDLEYIKEQDFSF
ncbi:hypothetical protein HD712_19095, partial [Clostridium gasigenes]|uniref:condensation domain-containing protein n=1 Tax=Clostridium gasigenes TaxID=94869 RepID=UPI0016B852FD